MFLSLNKQYKKDLLIATIMWVQELSKSELRFECYLGFTAKTKLRT
jgi:hypothetical protein